MAFSSWNVTSTAWLARVAAQGAPARKGLLLEPPASAPAPTLECVYFCHLDIIWINTPEKTVPYGLGGPARPRRSLKDVVPEMLAEPSSRCRCANQKDKKCLNFCQAGKDLWAQSTVEKTSRHRIKAGSCLGPKCMNRQLVDSRKMKRLEAIGNSIKASFSIAKLKAELQKGRKLKHNRASKRQSVRESLKAS
uniref:Endothelin-1 n=1 Tax=Zonotrichia albicollis TaxID=44394 RepID=A0A8D2M0W7_ZONAL